MGVPYWNGGTLDELCAETAAAARTVAPTTDETALVNNMVDRDKLKKEEVMVGKGGGGKRERRGEK